MPQKEIMARICIHHSTKNKLAKWGTLNSSWDETLNEILEHVESCDKFWSDRS